MNRFDPAINADDYEHIAENFQLPAHGRVQCSAKKCAMVS